MKRILFLMLVALGGFGLLCLGLGFYVYEFPEGLSGAPSEQPHAPKDLKPLPDIDGLASRMKNDQEAYRYARDRALAAYAKGRTEAKPYDEEARSTLRLFAYLSVWDDYYGEGLWTKLKDHSDNILCEGDKQPLWQIFYDVQGFRTITYNVDRWVTRYSETEAEGLEFSQEMFDYGQTDYPPLFKYMTYCTAINDLVQAKTASDTGPTLRGKFKPQLARLSELATATYGELIKAGYSRNFLFLKGRMLLDAGKADEETLKLLSSGLDRTFAANDKDSPLAAALKAEFYVDDAWNARGSDAAYTVTASGANLFAERLGEAGKILNDLYAKQPNEAMISDIMLMVVLGQGQPRDQMELWFERGIKADPDNFKIYMRKRWYLFPRWYGSDEQVQQFGLECANSENWSAKIPMIFVECVADAANRDPSIFVRPEIWQPLEKVYRGYLAHYPDSVYYRSLFAISAVEGEHWDVANEQFRILGDAGDRIAFEDIDYAAMKKLAARHAGK